MKNYFVKTSQSGTGITLTPAEIDEAVERRLEEREKKRKRDEGKRLLDSPSTTNTAEMSLIKQISNLAGKQGLNAEKLMEELTKRQFLIRRLLSFLSEDLVGDYFNKALVEYQMPLSKTYSLMEKSLDTAKKGIKLSDTLDFAIEHYNRNRDLDTTIYILENAADLHSKIPNLNVMSRLKNSLLGGSPASLNFIALGPENVDEFPLFNELLSLTQAKPEEDVIKLRLQYEKNRDALIRAMEIDDRYKGIFQTLLTDEFNRVLTRNVQLITSLFKLSTQSKEVMAARRILLQLQLGQGFLQQLESDIQQTTIAPTMERERTRGRFGSNNSRFVLAQQDKNTNIPQNVRAELLTKLVNPMIDTATKFSQQLSAASAKLPKNASGLLNSYQLGLVKFATSLKQLIGPLKSTDNFTIKQFNELFYGASKVLSPLVNTNDKDFEAFKSLIGRKTQASVNYRYSQAASGVQLSTWSGDISNITSFLSKFGQLAAGGMFLSGALNLDPIKMIGSALGLFFYRNNLEKMQELEKVGLPAPKDESTTAQRIEAEDAFRNFMEQNGQYQNFLGLKNLLDTTAKDIEEREKYLANLMSSEIRTGSLNATETVAFEDPIKVESEWKEFVLRLKKAFAEAQYYEKFMDKLVEIAKKPTPQEGKKVSPSRYTFLQTTIVPWQTSVKVLVNKFKALYFKYSSFDQIAKDMQSAHFFKIQLKTILPEYEKYLAAGSSIADLINTPDGLGNKLQQIINSERSARDTLYKSIVELKKLNPNVKPSGSTTEDMKTILQPTPKTASSNGFYFGNLIVEKKNKIEDIYNPETLAKSFIDNFRFSQAITEPNLNDQYQGLETSDIGVQPQQVTYSNTERVKHYQDKINLRKNLGILFDNIASEPEERLNSNEKEFLLSQIRAITYKYYKDKIEQLSVNTNPVNLYQNNFNSLKNSLLNETKIDKINKDILINSISKWMGGERNIKLPDYSSPSPQPGPQPEPGPQPTPEPEPTPPDSEDVPGRDEPSEQAVQQAALYSQAIFDELNREFGQQFSPDKYKEDPETVLRSMIQQWQQANARVNNLQTMYNNLLTQGNISGLSSLAYLENKFVKIADKEADQENIEYVGDYYNELYEDSDDEGYDYLTEDLPYGEALKDPEKWRKVPITKIKK